MLRLLTCLALILATPLAAATSDVVRGNAVEGRLMSVENGVGPGGATVSAGLHVVLDDGWKTYWRSPGEVGLPPDLNWEGSRNIASVTLSYPAPTRFEAFDIQNFGYGEEVVYPLTVVLEEPGVPARLDLRANLLVCAEICVPETLEIALDLPAGGGIDARTAATLSDWIAKVPGTGAQAGLMLQSVHLDETALTVLATSDTPFSSPDIFPEHGDWASFGKPALTLADGGRTLHAILPVLSPGDGPLTLTLTDGARAATLDATLSATAPAVPASGAALWWMVLVAALGGLILNVMPCVLPVLSMKLAGALQARNRSVAQVRAGFLASVAGVMVFFVGLAGVVIAAKAAGMAVGWGVQFQQPVFLALMIGLIVVFAASMFGFFHVGLSSGAMTTMARTEGRGGWGGDFATGMFAAVMATPCSAPFIGTAVTYALTHGPAQIVAVFAAMGLGLAAPYLAVAIRPGLIRRLPRPGAWMVTVQRILGGVLLLTAVWLVTVLAGSAGWTNALIVGGLAAGLLVALAARRWAGAVVAGGLAAVMLAAVVVPAPDRPATAVDAGWAVFEEARIMQEVAAGNVVFVDVTADWCLTCKANKRLVLDRGAVATALAGTVALQADWTRPDDAIADYLRRNDRFGIPFDAVYGPGAPQGIVLPELLTDTAVLDAIATAGG
ncbi:protein-disulfide reductase DsbD family protein [Jannaschia donghaensis]|uniref:Thiol:disulfide interchange protein DsbD n=1 Tax=Jannaschia donghaensis TaxID=420998 RepID=A0A0M6YL19_9RHOB|nr:protein-disulfide reductase DsbD domain-containing protein [Jannaschia donghaensis]CTQ49746.1 Thiol:disulfide interchange protein DsbD precursor [Jannaschia donghaensis]